MPLIQKNPPATGIFNGLTPLKGPKAVTLEFDFAVDNFIDVDLTQYAKDGTIDFIQGAWIDNQTVTNAAPVIVTIPGTKQSIVVPANSQGSYPIIISSELKFRVATTPGAGKVVTMIVANCQFEPR